MSDKLIRVMTALCCDTWLLPPQVHKMLTGIAAAHASQLTAQDQHKAASLMPENPKATAYEMHGSTAIIPIEGVLARKFSNVLHSSGITSTDILERLIRRAANDPAVTSIVLMIDSPGGYTTGVPEAGRAIDEARAIKPVVAYADGMMDSAAYWIGCHADLIYATESADVGCIGAYTAFLDESRAQELAGYKTELFKSGRFKGMGYPGTSLTEEHRTMLQADIDDTAAKFKAWVQAGRNNAISDDDMQGQSFTAEQALSRGLIDGITNAETAMLDAERLVAIRAQQNHRE